MKKFIITEEEKKEILGMYITESDIVEQTLNQDGTYITNYPHKFIPVGDRNDNPKFNPTFKTGTKIWTYFNKPDEDKIYFGSTEYYLQCSFPGYDNIIIYKPGEANLKENSEKSPLTSAVRKLFCNGKKGKKTWNEALGKKEETNVNKSKTIKLPNLTEKNFCNLAGDKVWKYAKDEEGNWYSSKNSTDWFKLELPKYQKAVDLLTKDAKCGTIEEIKQEEIGKLELKPVQQVQTNVKQPEIIQTQSQTIQKGLDAFKTLQNLQNKGV
jgi:hypothetical protein